MAGPNYVLRAVSALQRHVLTTCEDVTDPEKVSYACNTWVPRASDLIGGGATGAELYAAWKAWSQIIPNSRDYWFDDDGSYVLEDEDGEWLLDPNEFFTEAQIAAFDGRIQWQGRGIRKPGPDEWNQRTFFDLWVAWKELQAANADVCEPVDHGDCHVG